MDEKKKARWENGPRIVTIGGGHGLSALLRGLKQYTRNVTAIVTVADDGGGSGVLRSDLNMPPPGDIRNCMQALANTEPVMEQLLEYRFPEGRLRGQSFGNLLLAALNGISPSFDQAVARMSEVLAISGSFDEAVAKMRQVLAITGRILPVTTENVLLEATFENGAAVLGESKIAAEKKAQDSRILRVRLQPERPKAQPDIFDTLRDADLILLGPGSLYTSVIPNLLVDGVARAIRESAAPAVYIGNIMTQDGETEGMTLSDHVSALLDHSCPGLVDICIANCAPVPPELLERYWEEGAEPIRVDREKVEALGVEVVERPMISGSSQYARHSPEVLGRTVMELYEERADTKIF